MILGELDTVLRPDRGRQRGPRARFDQPTSDHIDFSVFHLVLHHLAVICGVVKCTSHGVFGQAVTLLLLPSPAGGIGVFVLTDVSADQTIEICPILPLIGGVRAGLADYCVRLPAGGTGIPLGYGALYNHSDAPNATWQVIDQAMVIRATQSLSAGDEVRIHYGARWFESRGRTPRDA